MIILPGEFHVSSQDIIATVLGSCISVCIKDIKSGIGGMNHFMLPGDVRSEEMFLSESAKYGMFAMEQLINEMIKEGGSQKALSGEGIRRRSCAQFPQDRRERPRIEH